MYHSLLQFTMQYFSHNKGATKRFFAPQEKAWFVWLFILCFRFFQLLDFLSWQPTENKKVQKKASIVHLSTLSNINQLRQFLKQDEVLKSVKYTIVCCCLIKIEFVAWLPCPLLQSKNLTLLQVAELLVIYIPHICQFVYTTMLNPENFTLKSA